MNNKLFSALALSVSLLFSFVHAQNIDQITGPISGEMDASNGVIFQKIQPPSDPNAPSGTSLTVLEGNGTLTISDTLNGGFPKAIISSGTTISSTRYWGTGVLHKNWWNGELKTPTAGTAIDPNLLKSNGSNPLQIVAHYTWGLPNETFSFNPVASLALPVNEPTGQKLLIAYQGSGGQYNVNDNDFCLVQQGLCLILGVNSMNSLALVKETYNTCPQVPFQNGQYGQTPSCMVTCDPGYILSIDGSRCELVAGNNIHPQPLQQIHPQPLPPAIPIVSNVKVPSGYVRFRGSGLRNTRKNCLLPEVGLFGEDLARVRALNRGCLTRNPRSRESQIRNVVIEQPIPYQQNIQQNLYLSNHCLHIVLLWAVP